MSDSELNKKAFTSGIWYLISTIILKSVSFLTIPLFSRLLTTREFGIFSIYNTWTSIFTVILSFNLSYSIGRAKFDYSDKLDEYIGSMHLLSLINSLFAIFVVLILRIDVAGLLDLDNKYLIFIYIYVLLEPSITYHQIIYRYQYKIKENIIISFIISLGSIVFSFIFIYRFTDNALARIVGSIIPVCILSMIFWIDILKRKKAIIDFEFWKYGLKLSVPLVFHKLSLHLLSQADRVIINRYCGSSDTGVYSLIYQYGSMISIITMAIADAWLPWFHDMMDTNNYEEIKEKVKPVLDLVCCMGIFTICIAPEMVLILGGKKYIVGIYVASPIILSVVMQYMYTQYVNIEMNMKRTEIIAISTMAAAGLNIVLNIIFIPLYGYEAAAYTTLIGYFTLFAIHYFNTKVIFNRNLYDNSYMLLALSLTIMVGSGVQFLYKYVLIRCILAFTVCVVFIARNKTYFIFVRKRFFKSKGE